MGDSPKKKRNISANVHRYQMCRHCFQHALSLTTIHCKGFGLSIQEAAYGRRKLRYLWKLLSAIFWTWYRLLGDVNNIFYGFTHLNSNPLASKVLGKSYSLIFCILHPTRSHSSIGGPQAYECLPEWRLQNQGDQDGLV